MPLLSNEEFESRKRELIGKKFEVLSAGSVELIDCMGSDRRIVDAARTTSGLEGKTDADDETLLRYLVRHRHSTPREFPQLTLRIVCPMDLWRQAIRHRMASVNEYSSRYSDVPDVNDKTPPDGWRKQSTGNRQGSSEEFVTEWPAEVVVSDPAAGMQPVGDYLSAKESELHAHQRAVYEERLSLGVAREQARKDLCLSSYTQAYWHWDLHNLMHFLGLRMDPHAQWEIRQYANIIGHEIVARLWPVSWQAFWDYQHRAVTLSLLDQTVLRNLLCMRQFGFWNRSEFDARQHHDWVGLKRCREREECFEKLVKLGLCYG